MTIGWERRPRAGRHAACSDRPPGRPGRGRTFHVKHRGFDPGRGRGGDRSAQHRTLARRPGATTRSSLPSPCSSGIPGATPGRRPFHDDHSGRRIDVRAPALDHVRGRPSKATDGLAVTNHFIGCRSAFNRKKSTAGPQQRQRPARQSGQRCDGPSGHHVRATPLLADHGVLGSAPDHSDRQVELAQHGAQPVEPVAPAVRAAQSPDPAGPAQAGYLAGRHRNPCPALEPPGSTSSASTAQLRTCRCQTRSPSFGPISPCVTPVSTNIST